MTMKNIYSKPETFAISITPSYHVLAGSGGPTEGLDHSPGKGGQSNGTQSVGAKQNGVSIWNDDNGYQLP